MGAMLLVLGCCFLWTGSPVQAQHPYALSSADDNFNYPASDSYYEQHLPDDLGNLPAVIERLRAQGHHDLADQLEKLNDRLDPGKRAELLDKIREAWNHYHEAALGGSLLYLIFPQQLERLAKEARRLWEQAQHLDLGHGVSCDLTDIPKGKLVFTKPLGPDPVAGSGQGPVFSMGQNGWLCRGCGKTLTVAQELCPDCYAVRMAQQQCGGR